MVQTFSVSNGLHVMVNNQSSSSCKTLDGLDVSTGTETSVSITKTISYQLPFPYSDCYSDKESNEYIGKHDSNLIEEMKKINMSYSQNSCFDLCFQQFIIEQCGCHLPSTYSFSSEYPCINILDMFCFYRKYEEYFDSYFGTECRRLCPSSCQSVKYSFSTSYSDFPSRTSLGLLFENEQKIKKYYNENNEKKLFSFNSINNEMINLNFYYDDLKYIRTSEIPNMSITQLISSIGNIEFYYISNKLNICFYLILMLRWLIGIIDG
jgi:hypothetical protein